LYLDYHHSFYFDIQACIAADFRIFEQGLCCQLTNTGGCQEEVGSHIYTIHIFVLSPKAGTSGTVIVKAVKSTVKCSIIPFYQPILQD
jgi:hypothetical protein